MAAGVPGGGQRRNRREAAAYRECLDSGIQRRRCVSGSFLNAGPISETVCLAAVALRAGRVRSGVRVYPAPIKLLYDSAAMKITNLPDANKYLTRDYRPGWEL